MVSIDFKAHWQMGKKNR